jgi:hypothetical protein
VASQLLSPKPCPMSLVGVDLFGPGVHPEGRLRHLSHPPLAATSFMLANLPSLLAESAMSQVLGTPGFPCSALIHYGHDGHHLAAASRRHYP